jgi:hypothetical protein
LPVHGDGASHDAMHCGLKMQDAVVFFCSAFVNLELFASFRVDRLCFTFCMNTVQNSVPTSQGWWEVGITCFHFHYYLVCFCKSSVQACLSFDYNRRYEMESSTLTAALNSERDKQVNNVHINSQHWCNSFAQQYKHTCQACVLF